MECCLSALTGHGAYKAVQDFITCFHQPLLLRLQHMHPGLSGKAYKQLADCLQVTYVAQILVF